VAALAETDRATGLDIELIAEIAEYFKEIKDELRCVLNPISEQIDTNVLIYQIPGGMLSNFVSQLKEQNALDKYNDVLKEVPRVRAELGYPPLVTPTSQIVGTQAVLNVLMGERYKVIPKEVKDYAVGVMAGPPQKIDSDIMVKLIQDEEPITCRPADCLNHEYEKMKAQHGNLDWLRRKRMFLLISYILL
jgi:pyruvate carboxylase subunit B